MYETPKNTIEFRVWGRQALFTDPITKLGGEKCSYHIPTYESLKGIAKSIYWKPTFIWVIDEIRVVNQIRTQTKGTKPRVFSGGNDLSIYTFLAHVEYQVRAHFVWNECQMALKNDRKDGKHFSIAKRMLQRGGRQDVFLGTRDCQGYVEPCEFGSGVGHYDHAGELAFGVMFHGFDYPDETGQPELWRRFTRPVMKDGYIQFEKPEECRSRELVREMEPKQFGLGSNVNPVEAELTAWGGE
ncbi:MAG: type I-C CRISPR-associated protein Cas5c [Rubripirellula sp.]